MTYNNAKTTPPQSVARKLTLLAMGIIATILVLLAISLVAGRTSRQQVQDSVADKIEGIAKTMDAADDTQRDLVQRAAKTLQQSF
jgi:methyl-accepting chemotaxis protein-2 (aspartate sensor receptor)